MNLLEETLEMLELCDKDESDVIQVQGLDYSISWQEFKDRAKIIDYNEESSVVEINLFLRIIGDGWWLERDEYNGSEQWVWRTPAKLKPSGEVKLTKES